MMIRLSVNVLTSAIALIERLDTYRFSSLAELLYSSIAAMNAEDIFAFSNKCGWVETLDNVPQLTSRGAALLRLMKQGSENELKMDMLADYVLCAAPIWTNRIPSGRREAVIFMSKDERACFTDAGLLSETPGINVVNWWDMIASRIRAQVQQSKTDTGRSGESCTIEYERARTNIEPKWMSLDSNLVGYDVQSKTSANSTEPLLIEVKTSKLSVDDADFHVTSNEWRVATTSKAYLFHLWSLFNGYKKLAILTPNEVKPYIPTNNLEGEWESAKIPFSCFAEKFISIE